MDDAKLSLRQIEKMEHAIGFERGKIKRNRYKVYRNWYIVNHPDDGFTDSVELNVLLEIEEDEI